MPSTTKLPPGFRALEPLLAYWAVPTSDIRWDRRAKAPMFEIQAFYDAMLHHADDALAYLAQFPLSEMPADAEQLFLLLLALPHAAMAVEFHHQPRAPYSPFPHGMSMAPGPRPYG